MAMGRFLMAGILCAAFAPTGIQVVSAQAIPSTPRYTYEVVSIHKADPGQNNSGFSPGPQGGLKARNNTVLQLLTFAWNVRDYQISGVPDWAKSDRFEISLTPDHADNLPDDPSRVQLDGWLSRSRERLQAVLRDRFGLVLKEETRDLPLYALTIAKNGPRLVAAKDPNGGPNFNINNNQQITAKSATMTMLADSLASLVSKSVRDETGLAGAYDFRLEFSPDLPNEDPGRVSRPSAADTNRPSLFTALTEQLGLRLESKKGPVKVFAIEKIERPAEN